MFAVLSTKPCKQILNINYQVNWMLAYSIMNNIFCKCFMKANKLNEWESQQYEKQQNKSKHLDKFREQLAKTSSRM